MLRGVISIILCVCVVFFLYVLCVFCW
uniref:Uncharacterized protein n=1 Tax=Anguilla anguilla TaxID=7936 RepID=A0A0E9QRH2_ANGAN